MKKIIVLAMGGIILSWAAIAQSYVTTNKPAPDFSLTDIKGQTKSLSEYRGKFVVLEWTNYDCPFVKKHYSSGNMQSLQREYTQKGAVWLSICSSAQGKQGHYSPAEWAKLVVDRKSAATAVLLDGNGKVGRLYGAKTTPHIFIIDPKGILIYQGAIDSIASTDSSDIPKATNYVRQTLNEALTGKPVTMAQTDSYGCSVKY